MFNRRQPLAVCGNFSEPLRLPLDCANCLAPSTRAVRCRVPAAAALLVPYCSRCHKTLESAKTRVTLAVCASLLGGMGALVAVPLSAWPVSTLSYAGIVAVTSCVPLILALALRPRLVADQTSSDVAVWFESRALVGTNTRWMTALADDNQGQLSMVLGRVRSWPWPTFGAAIFPTALALVLYRLFYPTVVVLNLSAGEFELWVDGHRRLTLGVSSLESADAPRRLTVPVGRHRFEARLVADGELLQAADVDVDALGGYLFAPGAVGHCFWTEAATYGKNRTNATKRRLGIKDGFIVLPRRIDTWFGPNPEVSEDSFSSGGEMVAVRHGRCSE